jgi:isocitrate dehydrogenase (NAD+)
VAYRVTLIPGDGIGQEVIDGALRVLEATGIAIEWDVERAGLEAIPEHGSALPQRVLDSIKKNKVALKGPTATPTGGGHRSVNVELRQSLELFANVRPFRSLLGMRRRYDPMDLVVVRENTEDLFSGHEHNVAPGVAVTLKVVTEKASTRVARFAFEYARKHGRKRVTAAHKATIMKLSDGLFLKCCRAVAADYPEIRYDEILVDNLCTQLVLHANQFDVLVMGNMYGDIVSDLCAGLVGGLGLACGGNIGEGIAVFECVHGTAPDIAGKGIANPVAMILTTSLLLDHLGEEQAAERIRTVTRSVLQEGAVLTRDLGGTATTKEFADAVRRGLA